MKKFLSLLLIMLSFVVYAQTKDPVINNFKYSTIVETGTEYDPNKKVYYPTTVTIDISDKIVTFEYTEDNEKELILHCRIYDYDTRKTDEYIDIYTKSINDEKIRFRLYDDNQIIIILKEMYIVLEN